MIFTTSLIGLLFAVFFARSLGALGAGFGSGIGLIIYIIWLNIFYKNNLKLNLRHFFTQCHGKILPFMATYSIIAFFLIRMLTIDNWFLLIGTVVIYSLFYFFVAYCMTFNTEEKNIVNAFKLSRK